MTHHRILIIALSFASLALSQDVPEPQAASNFKCPEKNGFFSDLEQCDLYFECVDNIPEAKLCPDGLLFDDTNPNVEKCDYPFNVECGTREFVQEPDPTSDPRCYRANGFFNHEEPTECGKFYNCVHGKAHELPCATPLVFDEALGTCVREEQATEFAKKCPKDPNQPKPNIEGFSCPDEPVIGPHGQPYAHPSFSHPTSCQKFITCYFSKDIRELGCMQGQVFDHVHTKCVLPEEGPKDCACWYSCNEDSKCPDTCNSDCSCSSS
ncbi:unnamed protein product [Lepeophtheirus salmonis]|uniref:(salmon louse) hypothetical protein n=1 Tax=Lepeophtheirus salmonis TaxID=72036 RepID=D3PGU0_LEPSM|nr:protein obstructor-E-like [Lepeophtheirus salmonis]ADD24486.1 Peritrophin-1 [Lepeophtheirus salmonis]CAB4055437.1 unnamed protein product [Lepeophtheirus salmonis]CAF2775077.1 unnamed protein product [Lepeophtheirus salmonis]